jgi:hypothetical protein
LATVTEGSGHPRGAFAPHQGDHTRYGSKTSLVLLCTAALGLAACGSSGSTSSPSATKPTAKSLDPTTIIAAAFTKTSAAKSARLALTYQVTSGTATSASGVNERATGSGVINFVGKQADLTVIGPTGQSIEERLIGTVAYVKLPSQLAHTYPQLHGKTWLSQKIANNSASLGFGSGGSDASDPTSILRLVSIVSDRVDKIGTESVRGTPTTHYRATVSFAKAAAKQGLPRAQIQAVEKAIGTATFPVDLWIDDQGVARRMQFRFPLPKATSSAAAGQSGHVTETLELFDFGTPVSVAAPPASQTADASALIAPSPSASPSVRKG